MPEPSLNLVLDDLEDAHGLAPTGQDIYDAFTAWVSSTGKQMYPHQEEALTAIVSGDHVIVSTPTGSGKSLIAMQALFTALATGRTAYYTAPLKALVSEKFFDLIEKFGAHNVGMITGDSAINANAPIICATAEILANLALREGAQADAGVVVMDEFHFYAEPDRGWAWQVPLLELTNTQHVLLSATLGDTDFFVTDLRRRTGREVSIVADAPRPVPLHYIWSTDPIGEEIQELVATHMSPVYVVHSSQRAAVAGATALLSMSLISREQKDQIAAALANFKFNAGFGKTLSKLLRAGIGVHHAGLLPRYRRLVERLTQAGLLAVICGTDTLGVGINVPIRTVLITSLVKFDGNRVRTLRAREFHQIAGRAGRAGYDTVGYVVVSAPEHEIENARRVRKAGGDPAKLKRVQRVKPPEGEVSWSEKTFQQLKDAPPEVLRSRMRVNHAMILNLMQRPDPVAATAKLLTDNHEPPTERNLLLRQALDIYQTLRTAEVIRHEDRNWRRSHPGENAVHFAKNVPSDFALNAPLSPFALAALELLDPDSDTYALDVVSVIEAVQEDPTPVLYAQRNEARGQLINELKAAGVEYHERMARADEVTWPQPLIELLEPALATYAQSNPWVVAHELSPKSVVRQMIEEGNTFSEFISRYDLTRAEGILLRYLTDVYRALRQSVPIHAATAEVEQITDWLGALVRSIDSSLLDEWEALAAGRTTVGELDFLAGADATAGEEAAFGADADGKVSFSRNQHAVRKALRNALFQRVTALDRDDYSLLDKLDRASGWDGDRWADTMDAYWDTYDYLNTGPRARSAQFFAVLTDPTYADLLAAGADPDQASDWLETHAPGRLWLATQVLDDAASRLDTAWDDGADLPEPEMTWAIWAVVDLDASDEAGELALQMLRLGPRL
ncbi:MAG: DUF3516 domain-containing protein [Trueperella sp.]|nr:DUF3516 domain-containing protein [Trueperella sp.]